MPLSEDRILERSVNSLINEKGRKLQIVLHRPTKTRNERGGLDRGDDEILDPQPFRLIPFKRRLTLEYRDNPTERTTLIDYILTGPIGSDVQADDWFEYQNEVWRVDHVSALTYHRVQATVARRQEQVA